MFRKIPLALNNTTCKFIFVKLYITTGEMQENYSGRRLQSAEGRGKKEASIHITKKRGGEDRKHILIFVDSRGFEIDARRYRGLS
jgi:hypothetical protein